MRAIVVIATSITATSAAYGQEAIRLGVGAGVTIPAGSFRDTYNPKENLLLSVAVGPQAAPIGVRFDYSYNELAGRHAASSTPPGTHLNILTANVVMAAPGGAVKPYVVAGGGWYRFREATSSEASSDLGLNAGLGCTFPFFSQAGFVEARYHRIFAKTVSEQLVPVTFGILF